MFSSGVYIMYYIFLPGFLLICQYSCRFSLLKVNIHSGLSVWPPPTPSRHFPPPSPPLLLPPPLPMLPLPLLLPLSPPPLPPPHPQDTPPTSHMIARVEQAH